MTKLSDLFIAGNVYDTSDADITVDDITRGKIGYGPLGRLEWVPPPLPELAGLVMHSVIGDIADFYQDSIKTTPVTVSGDPVGAWVDKSGNGNDFIQATAGSRPEYQGTTIAFVAETLQSPAWLVPDEYMIGGRFERSITTDTRGILSIGNTAATATPHLYVQNTGTGYQISINNGYHFFKTLAIDTPHSLVLKVTKPASNYLIDCWFDGVKQTQYDAGASLYQTGTTIPVWLATGYGGITNSKHKCIVLAEGAYTDTDATDLSDYLDGL